MSKEEVSEDSKVQRKHPKYINPATDFGFKRIFKDEEITRGFLNELVKTQDPTVNIAKVTIIDGECDESNKDIRRVVYDVHCETDTGEEFVIEMQNSEQIFFAERIVYYLSRAASRQQGKGTIDYIGEDGEEKKRDWDYHLKKIYGVFFMNFINPQHPDRLSHFTFMETTKMYKDTDVFQYWKIQMPLYRNMKESDCKTNIDKWIFNLSNMDAMDTQLSFTEEIPLFMRLGNLASYSALNKAQQIAYDDSYNNYLAYRGSMEYKLREGIRIGKEEGRAEGEHQKALSIARAMKQHGDDIDYIAAITGLTPDEIAAL